jgi:hypothetical protein
MHFTRFFMSCLEEWEEAVGDRAVEEGQIAGREEWVGWVWGDGRTYKL